MLRSRVEARVGDLLPTLYALRPIEAFPSHALAILRSLIAGDKAHYTEVDLQTGDFRVLVDPEPSELARLADARRTYMHENPILRHFLSPNDGNARATSDFLTQAEYHRLGLYAEFFRPLNVEEQLAVTITDGPMTPGAAVCIDRGRRSFTPGERRALDLLRPHLVAARVNAVSFSNALAGPPDRPRRLERLTSRQIDVLTLVAAGHTNDRIALELNISPGTVRKHVEHILERLEATTRTAAAAILLTSARSPSEEAWTRSEPRMISNAT